MLSMYEREILAYERRQALLREAIELHEGPSIRESVAGALIALAVWLAPSTRGAVAGQAVQGVRAPRPA